MNGYISGTKVVEEYTKKINDLFQRENYLNKQREEFENENPDYAFTEMRAFLKYMEEEKVNIGKLAKVSDGKRMDDFLSCRQGFDSEKLNGKEVKKIEMREGGRFFGRMEGREVEIASTDLSFLPVKVFKIMHDHYISDKHVGKTLGEAYNPNIYEKGKIAAGRFLESLGFDLKGS
jgi:hypothetical protein